MSRGLGDVYKRQVQDEIILSIRNSEIENSKDEDNKGRTIKVEQLQLSTQRMK